MKAIIYIPGLAQGMFSMSSIDSYAYRYLSALDLANNNPAIKYKLSYNKLRFGKTDECLSNTAIITQINEDKSEEEVCKVFELEYVDLLTRMYNNKNIFVKMWYILWFIFTSGGKIFISFFRKKGRTLRQTTQLMYVGLVLFIVFLAGISLLPSVITQFVGLWDLALEKFVDQSSFDITYRFSDSDFFNAIDAISKVILGASAFIAVFFSKAGSFISEASNRLLGLNGYLTLGNEKLNISGRLETLLERIAEDEQYDSLEIHGFSLGSVVALDTIYPFGHEPSKRITQEVNTLVTIGCSFEFITSIFPYYFKNRRCENLSLSEWYNIYSKADVISSNFRKDFKSLEAEFGIGANTIKPINIPFELINTRQIGVVDFIMFIGIRAHTMYWGKESDSINCLKDLLLKQEIFEKSRRLAS